MRIHKELWRRLQYLTRRSRFHSELGDEIEFHIESRADELEQQGLPRAEALARARREFGSARRAVEDTHGAWEFRWLEDLFSDLRYAARAFRRNPAFALTAIFCLALGIGANTTMFSLTTSFLFSQPSCRDAASLISIWEGGNSSSPVTDYKFLRDAHVFEGVAGMNPERELNWRDGDHTVQVYVGTVTDDYFQTMGVPFRLGRGIAPGETTTVVISHRLWRSHFGQDPDVLGRKLVLDGRIYTVAGVLPDDHRSIMGFGFAPDIYAPVLRDDDFVQFYARMPRGMTIAVARARLHGIFQELDRIRPNEGGWKRTAGTRVTSIRGVDYLRLEMPGPVLAFFAMLMVVVGLVLLIACTNVASLLLARASSRSQELAVRLALGASRRRVIRHLLAESLLLAVLGSAAGLLINLACADLVSNINLPVPVPVHLVISPDWRLLLYSASVAVLSALLSGLIPAVKAVRKDVNAALGSGERQTGRTWGLRSVLVTGQLAVSIVLLAAGFLFVHNLLRATVMNPGFDVNHIVWAHMRLVPQKYTDSNKQTALVNEALEHLRALPGVETVALTRHVPLNDNCRAGTDLRTDVDPQRRDVQYECNEVGPDYFRTMRIPLLHGREFNVQDGQGSQRVGIVNQKFASAVFGPVNPIGHTLYLHDGKPLLVVGLVADSKYFSFSEDQRLALFEVYGAGSPAVNLNFMVRTPGPPSGYVKPITNVLDRLDSTAAIETKPMSRALGLALLPSRAGAAMLGAMGVLGLALAAIGLYGVLLYSVSRRTREIGLRVALGATPGEVLRLVCRHSFSLVGAGVAVGLALAFFAMRPLAMFLVPGVSPSDPAAFLAVVGVLAAIALLATVAPALRALRVDPMTALRYE